MNLATIEEIMIAALKSQIAELEEVLQVTESPEERAATRKQLEMMQDALTKWESGWRWE